MGKYVGEGAWDKTLVGLGVCVVVGVVLLIVGMVSILVDTKESGEIENPVMSKASRGENDIIQEWEAQGNLSNLVRIHHLTFEGREYLVAEGRHGLAICPVQGGMVRIK